MDTEGARYLGGGGLGRIFLREESAPQYDVNSEMAPDAEYRSTCTEQAQQRNQNEPQTENDGDASSQGAVRVDDSLGNGARVIFSAIGNIFNLILPIIA